MTFTIAGYGPQAVLHVTNGNADGSARATSAEVTLGGNVIVLPSSFTKKTASFDIPVTLGNPATLGVRVASDPGDQITISVDAQPATTATVPATGGTAHLLGTLVTLGFPSDALSGAFMATATPVSVSDPLVVSGTALELGPSPTRFGDNVAVSVQYDPAALPRGAKASFLRLAWRGVSGWQPLPGNSVDATNHVVTAQTNHFSTFAVLSVAPDFTVSAFSAQNVEAYAGESVNVSATVTNGGTASAPASTVGFYIASGHTPTTADQSIGSAAVPALDPGQSFTVTATVVIPAALPPGSYSIAAIADPSNAVDELDETNNTRSLAFTVMDPNPAYTVTVLPSLGGSSGRANAINDAGLVAGQSGTPTGRSHAAYWTTDNGAHELPGLSGLNSNVFGMNNRGEMVGVSVSALDGAHAAYWSAAGAIMDLGTAGAGAKANGINDAGLIVGQTLIADDESGSALAWASSTSPLQNFGTLGGAHNAAFASVNAFGQVTLRVDVDFVTSIFVWTTDGMQRPLPGFGDTRVNTGMIVGAINDSGLVAASGSLPSDPAAAEHAALTRVGGPLVDVGLLGTATQANAINVHGTIVGLANVNGDNRAWFWNRVAGIVVLPLPPGATGAARAINGGGVIVGSAVYPDGSEAAVKWTP